MIGIGIATATAGIIVGGITLTGLGLAHDRVRRVRLARQRRRDAAASPRSSAWCWAWACRPRRTTSLVATLMAPVIVELGAQSGLVDPADRRASVRLLLRHHGRRDAACRAGHLRGRSDLGRRPDRDRHPGLALAAAHRDPAVRLHLQSAAAADRRPRPGRARAAWCWRASWRRCCFAAATMSWFPSRAAVGDGAAAAGGVRCCSGPITSWTCCTPPYRRAPAKEIYAIAERAARLSR